MMPANCFGNRMEFVCRAIVRELVVRKATDGVAAAHAAEIEVLASQDVSQADKVVFP